jgi:hypothetical protein
MKKELSTRNRETTRTLKVKTAIKAGDVECEY